MTQGDSRNKVFVMGIRRGNKDRNCGKTLVGKEQDRND